MIATEVAGQMTGAEYHEASGSVKKLIRSPGEIAVFRHTDNQVVEVYSTIGDNNGLNSFLQIDIRTTDPVIHPNGSELFPYEGIKIIKPEKDSGGHRIYLVSGTRKRNHKGILVDQAENVDYRKETIRPALAVASLEESAIDLSGLDEEYLDLVALDQRDADYQSYLSVLKGLDRRSRLDLDAYGRTHKKAFEESRIVGHVTLLAAEIAEEAFEAGQIHQSRSDFSFRTRALPIVYQDEAPQHPEAISILQQRGPNATGYEHIIYVVGAFGDEQERFRVNRLTDGRLQRRLPDRRYGNPVGPEIGRGLVQKMQRVSIGG